MFFLVHTESRKTFLFLVNVIKKLIKCHINEKKGGTIASANVNEITKK